MYAKQTYTWVSIPKGTSILKSRIFLDVEADNFGRPIKHKNVI